MNKNFILQNTRSYDEWLIEQLKDPKESLSYLEAAFDAYQKDGDTTALQIALRSVAEALGGNREYFDEVEEKFDLELRPRETEKVSIKIPKDVLKALKQVAENRDMSAQALLKFYIGQGLRQDIARPSPPKQTV